MSGRATSAFLSRRAKENLVRILFPTEKESVRRKAHLPKSVSRTAPPYSYRDLRSAYLRRLQDLHPDKHATTTDKNNTGNDTKVKGTGDEYRNDRKRRQHDQFVTLQSAWDEYEKVVKLMHGAQKNSLRWLDEYNADNGGSHRRREVDADPNFTMFGVGCSFADSPEERDRRNKIMDQASHGFFYSGLIPQNGSFQNESAVSHGKVKEEGQEHDHPLVSLVDDDMFINTASEVPLAEQAKCFESTLAEENDSDDCSYSPRGSKTKTKRFLVATQISQRNRK